MKREFVKTENARRFRSTLGMLEGRGALEAGMLLVVGRPGEGKTMTLHNWAAEVGAVMLTAQEGWTPNRMLSELRKNGIIEYRGHLIFIKDIDYLKDAIQCENCGREICNIE